ncbi:helicase-related protein [Pseudaquabacterium rugosum]|uniref:Helicase-related protein n=1 Tax=Pseudaquabacterium rugosum TaxID=2984194 RepID=A0ABU9B761_9BURK
MSDTPRPEAAAAAPVAPAVPAAALHLPHPAHAQRLPAHLDLLALARVRQNAWALPQVESPGDYLDTEHPGPDAHLDQLGMIQLQKASGTRPSRWIHPQLMDAALAHLDALGGAPDARSLLIKRRSALDAMGISRHGGRFWRQIAWPVPVPVPPESDQTGDDGMEWPMPVPFRVEIADAPVWAWYVHGERERLLRELGAKPAHPQAATLTDHLRRLVARSHALAPQQLGELLPRLQAECAAPHASTETLLAALTRVQDRWEQRVTEAHTLAGLNHELAFHGYPDSFPKARELGRTVTLYVGPPNSGKTHAAFERLATAESGAYLAPLRLLALEGRDRLVARGVPCSLLTGEESVRIDGARAVSSTIEMVSTNTVIDVAVIDEAQMIFDPSRGWAWTQAVVAVPAREVIIICSDFAVPALRNLLGLCGERCTTRHFERKQQVELLPRPVSLESLRQGDAVVAFSRRSVLGLRDQLAEQGRSVSVIYGALPPEVRRREAERYAQGESQILVATDAIGMGLNLPIRRVLFSTLTKFDGVADRLLGESEVHQIAGRAGRFGIQDEGFAGVLDSAEPNAGRWLKELMARTSKAPKEFKAPVAPNGWHVQTISARLGARSLREVLGVFVERLMLDDAHFAVAQLDEMLALAEALDEAAPDLPLMQRFTYAQAPVDTRIEDVRVQYLHWARQHALMGEVDPPAFLDQVHGGSRLDRMEQALRACTLWLWLDLRFPGVYGYVSDVQALREELNDGIERQLTGQRALSLQRGPRAGFGGGGRGERGAHGGPRPPRGQGGHGSRGPRRGRR